MAEFNRLTELLERLKADSGEYKDLETPKDPEGKRTILRSLMNIRMPREMPADVIRIQDEYLKERSEEKRSRYAFRYPRDTGWPVHMAGRYHKACGRRDRERGEFPDAWLLQTDA